MKITLENEEQIEVKTLFVKAGVRYFEDATVNGIKDTEGELIPCKDVDMWCPIIDIESGIILNWDKGTRANIHYKVCDNGRYYLTDEDGNIVLSIEDNYVPNIMCPKEEGYGDYIIMDVDENGKIADWNPTFDEFLNNQ